MEYNGYVEDLQKQLIVRGEDIEDDGKYGKQTHEANLRQLVPYDTAEGSPHFGVKEFKCNCHGRYCDGYPEQGISADLFILLEEIRAEVNRMFPKDDGTDRTIVIRAGYRCPEYNEEVGGASKSQHLYGKAADIYSKGITPKTMGEICDRLNPNGGVGLGGNSITHCDCRGYRARWNYN